MKIGALQDTEGEGDYWFHRLVLIIVLRVIRRDAA
jgi:hypothetical protein